MEQILTKEVISTICIAIFSFFVYIIIKKTYNKDSMIL